jgi:DNA polymerase-3 subunit delta'
MNLLEAAAEAVPTDPWSPVVGQPQAVAALAAAVASPVHAYLLVGPRGAGKRTAAAAFAGELIVAADERAGAEPERAERHRRLAGREDHPDVFVLSPAGNSLRREEEVAQLIVEASRTPVEGTRKVLVVERFHSATPAAAAALLKPVEEPAASVVWLLLAEQVLPEHVTIASRCTRVDFGPVPDDEVAAVLVSEGSAAADRAPLVAAAAAGNLHRARVLAADERVAARREAWWSAPERLDGTGAAVTEVVAELRALIDDAGEALTERHRIEMVALGEREAQFGTRGSGRRDIEAQHKREHRQFRTDEIRFGLATLTARYRERIASEPNDPAADRRAMRAIDRLRATAEILIRSPNEALALQALFLDLPPVPQAAQVPEEHR